VTRVFFLSPLEVDSNLLVILHGLGDRPESYANFAKSLNLPQVRYFFLKKIGNKFKKVLFAEIFIFRNFYFLNISFTKVSLEQAFKFERVFRDFFEHFLRLCRLPGYASKRASLFPVTASSGTLASLQTIQVPSRSPPFPHLPSLYPSLPPLLSPLPPPGYGF
jgi:hypothetical protein